MNVTEEQNGFVAQGEVISYEQIQTRSGRNLVKMTITDFNDSLDVRFFHENDGKFKGGIKERDWVKVRGDLRPDKYSHDELTLTPGHHEDRRAREAAWTRPPKSAWSSTAIPK